MRIASSVIIAVLTSSFPFRATAAPTETMTKSPGKQPLTVVPVPPIGSPRPVMIFSPSGQVEKKDVTPTPHLQLINQLLFDKSLKEFSGVREEKVPGYLDWTSNGCSKVPDRPFGFDFKAACQRHDFGYRNYKIEGQCSDIDRLRLDGNLENDMVDVCRAQKAFADFMCRLVAETYYQGVRMFGGASFCK